MSNKIFLFVFSFLSLILQNSKFNCQGLITACSGSGISSDNGNKPSFAEDCIFITQLSNINQSVIAISQIKFVSSNFDISLTIQSFTNTSATVNITSPSYTKFEAVRFHVFALENDGYSFAQFFKFSDNPDWSTFNSGINRRRLIYTTNYWVQESSLKAPYAYVFFSRILFDNSSAVYTLNHTIISISRSQITFEISIWGDCRIIELHGSLLVLSAGLRDGVALEAGRHNIDSLDPLVNDITWYDRSRAGVYNFTHDDFKYEINPFYFFLIGAIDIVKKGQTFIAMNSNFGFEESGSLLVQLLYYAYADSEYRTFNFIVFTFCKPIKNCIRKPSNTMINFGEFNPIVGGTPMSIPKPDSRSFCFNQIITQRISEPIRYFAIIPRSIEFWAASKFKIVVNNYTNANIDFCVEIGPNDYISQLPLGSFVSSRDGAQSYLYDFSNHSSFNNTLGSPGINRRLNYTIYFKPSKEIGEISDALISFTEWDVNYYGNDNFDLSYKLIAGFEDRIIIEISSSSSITFKSLKGYILIWGKYQTLILRNPVSFSKALANSYDQVTLSKSGYFSASPTSFVNFGGINFNTSSNYFGMISFTTSNTYDSVSYRLTSLVLRVTVNSVAEYSSVDHISLCTGPGFPCRFLAEPILKTPNASITQQFFFMSDFTRSWIFMLFITDYCNMTGTFFNFGLNLSSNPRFIYIAKFFNTTDFESSLTLPSLSISSNQNVTYSVMKMINTEDCAWYGIYSYISNYSKNWDFSYDSAVGSCSGSNILPNLITLYPTIILNLVYHFENLASDCISINITYDGEIRALYLNSQFLFAGNSSTIVTSNSFYNVSVGQTETFVMTAVGDYKMRIYKMQFFSEGVKIFPETFTFSELYDSKSSSYSQNTTYCDRNCLSCRNSTFCYACKYGFFLIRGQCVDCDVNKRNSSNYSNFTTLQEIYTYKNKFYFTQCPCGHNNCNKCRNDQCISCEEPYVLLNGSCLLKSNESDNHTKNIMPICFKDSDCIIIGARCLTDPNSTAYCQSPSSEYTVVLKTVQAVATAVISSTIPMMMMGGDPTLMWSMANLLQLFYYMLFFNVKYPSNLKGFLNIFALGRLSFLPNPFENMLGKIENTLPSPTNFYENNFTGMMLQSSGTFIFLNLAMIGYFFLLKILTKITFPYQAINKFIENQYDTIRWGGLLRTYIGTYFELTICAFLQLFVIGNETNTILLSSMLGIFFAVFNFVAPINALIILTSIKKIKSNEPKFRPLIEDFDISDDFKRNFIVFILTRRFIQGMGLVLLYNTPILQAIIVWLPNFMILVLLIARRPHIRAIMNLLDILQESILLTIHSIITIFAYDDSLNNIFSEDKKYFFGWIVIGLCFIIFFANFLSLIMEQIKSFKFLIKLLKKKKKKNIRRKLKKLKSNPAKRVIRDIGIKSVKKKRLSH